MKQGHEEMMNLYDHLSINDKRNEFSTLLEKTNQIVSELLKIEQINNDLQIKNYNTTTHSKFTESEMLTFLYEDLWNLKNRLLTFLIMKSEK